MNLKRIQKFLRSLEKDYKKPTGLKTSETERFIPEDTFAKFEKQLAA